MSNVYSSEPPTSGKVILVTTYGNIDIELWTKEAPRTCKNFIQLCLEGYYNDCVFHRIIKEFMIQTGDPKSNGGESIWGTYFTDEYHSRLRFNHRGIVAMANKNRPNTNGSQFFITMNKCPWLDKKHTIFGKVVGQTYFNAHAISELPTKDDFPVTDSIPKIIRCEVVINPFSDIVPRKAISNEADKDIGSKKETSKNTVNSNKLANSNLISFDDDFDDGNTFNKNVKIKPIHETINNDKKLINKPVVQTQNKKRVRDSDELNDLNITDSKSNIHKDKVVDKGIQNQDLEEDDIEVNNFEEDNDNKNNIVKNSKLEEMKKEILEIKKRTQAANSSQKVEEEVKLTPLQKIQKDFLENKRYRQSTQDKIQEIERFKEKLKAPSQDNWMNNKLKFHVDSQKAYNLNDIREKQQKNFDISLTRK
jgi:peptidyl-prolyl cis-trans isomerase SDCCAG10